MSSIPKLRDAPDLPQELIESGLNGKLVIFVGAGISMLNGMPSWNQLAQRALEELREKKFIDYSDREQLSVLGPRTQLSIAQLIAQENGHHLQLSSHFQGKGGNTSAYRWLNQISCPFVTTNYDELLLPRGAVAGDGSSTGSVVTRITSKEDLYARRLDEPGVVVHIHGAISNPASMVVTTKDYLAHYDHENVQHFLGELFSKKTVLFLGYGLEESEVLEHILRRGKVERTSDRRRFALQGYFQSQEPLYRQLHNYYRASFGVHVIGFARDQSNYDQQEAILQLWAPKLEYRPPALVDDLERMKEVLRK